MKFFFDGVKNTVGKGGNAGHQSKTNNKEQSSLFTNQQTSGLVQT